MFYQSLNLQVEVDLVYRVFGRFFFVFFDGSQEFVMFMFFVFESDFVL